MDTIEAMDKIESVNEAALDLVVGGVQDDPARDVNEQRRIASVSGDGTLGGTVGDVLLGAVTSHLPNTPGHPVEYPQ